MRVPKSRTKIEAMGSAEEFGLLPEILPCPVCLDLPRGKVFQCRNGHTLCEECYAQLKLKLDICPQCRIPFDPKGIRSLAVEMLLDGSAFHINCIYEGNGCKVKVNNLKKLRDHAEFCRFSPTLSICKRLGFRNCAFGMNGETPVEEAIHHFETFHGALTSDSDKLEVEFSNYAKFSGGTKLLILNRKEKGYACLIQAKHVRELHWSPFYLRYPKLGNLSGSGDESTRYHFIASSLLNNPKPKNVFFYNVQPLSDILSYGEAGAGGPVVNFQQYLANKSIWRELMGTSGSLFVFIEIRKIGDGLWESGCVPRITLTPDEMKRNGAPEGNLDRKMLRAPVQESLELPLVPISLDAVLPGPASLKLDWIPDILLCTVCRKLPVSNVFQCREGHILCEECNARDKPCRKCRTPFEKPAIRSLAVEMLLDEFELTFELCCRHEVNGCNVRMANLKSFRDHVKSCNFRFGPSTDQGKGLGFGTFFFQRIPWTRVEQIALCAVRNDVNADNGASRGRDEKNKKPGPNSRSGCRIV